MPPSAAPKSLKATHIDVARRHAHFARLLLIQNAPAKRSMPEQRDQHPARRRAAHGDVIAAGEAFSPLLRTLRQQEGS